MGAKSYYFEDNQIKVFSDPTANPEKRPAKKNVNATLLSDVSVLVIDDNPINLIVAQKTLQKFGANVKGVLNGNLGVDAYAEATYDLVLMDLQMPSMNGYESTKLLKKSPAYIERPAPVIAYTTFSFDEVKEQMTEANMDGYIGKPFTQSHVLDHIWHVIEASREKV